MDKEKNDYSQLLRIIDEEDKSQTLYSAQCVSYKMLLRMDDVDTVFPIEWKDVDSSTFNPYFDDLKNAYDGITQFYLQNARVDKTEMYKISRDVIGKRGKSVKHAKKRSSRVLRAVKKHFKGRQYSTSDRALAKAIVSFHYAFRESFINVRVRINKSLYDAIPSDLTIQFPDGRVLGISDLYKWDERRACYALSKDISLSKTDMRAIQLAISPIIFSEIDFPKGL